MDLPTIPHLYALLSLTALIAAQLLDTLTTLAALALGGREINPLARWAMRVTPGGEAVGLLLLKAVNTVFLVLALPHAWMLCLCSAVIMIVAAHNARVIRGLLDLRLDIATPRTGAQLLALMVKLARTRP